MTSPRAPMEPPDLPGFDHVRLLGSGGYSDVFLYEQRMPRRQVAIKVLLENSLGDAGRQQFYDEANAMAAVSTHPFIVTVFNADVSASGHPFLVMEFYPRQNFSVRARGEQISVADVLRTGIQVASAVETAHRADILHRDIKPANILTSEYNRPGLTDFGIATSSADGAEAEGMSIPWSPPEVVNGVAPGDVTADVYSLAATVYTLLAGRSPFEVVGGSNRSLDLVKRIEAGDPAPTGRPDVPASLERVLRHGMSRAPMDRPGSAAEFARMLQGVEIEQGWSATQLEIREDPRDVRDRDAAADEDGTRLKGPVVIRSQGTGPGPMVDEVPGANGRATPGAAALDSTVHRRPDAVEGGTVHRGDAAGPGPGNSSSLIGTVGSRPVGFAGGAPEPVRPRPSTDVGARSTATGDGAPGNATEDRGPSRTVMAAVAVFVLLGSLIAVRLVMANGSVDEPDGERADVMTDNTLPVVAGTRVTPPSQVRLGPVVDGRREVTWTHQVDDPADYDYLVVDPAGRLEPVAVDGRTSALVGREFACVRVVAISSAGSSDENASESFSDEC